MIKTRQICHIRLFRFFLFSFGWGTQLLNHFERNSQYACRLACRQKNSSSRTCTYVRCTRSLHLFFYLQHIDMTSCFAIELLACLIFDNWINSHIFFIWNGFVFLSDPYSYRHFILFFIFLNLLFWFQVWGRHQ